MIVTKEDKKTSKIEYSAICDTCGEMILNGKTRDEKFIYKYLEEKNCKVFKTTNKIKCSNCLGKNNKKPSWAR